MKARAFIIARAVIAQLTPFGFHGVKLVMMTEQMRLRVRQSLIAHEGYVKFPYIDTVGKTTIGIGYNLTDRGLPEKIINSLYDDDVQYFYSQLSEFSWFSKLNEDRQIVLIDMSFMGVKKLLGFSEMIKALEKNDFNRAADEILNSRWASDVGIGRSHHCSDGMRSGVYQLN